MGMGAGGENGIVDPGEVITLPVTEVGQESAELEEDLSLQSNPTGSRS